jgi:hypothetical protein
MNRLKRLSPLVSWPAVSLMQGWASPGCGGARRKSATPSGVVGIHHGSSGAPPPLAKQTERPVVDWVVLQTGQKSPRYGLHLQAAPPRV